jgi:ArsR family transcriptional regulator
MMTAAGEKATYSIHHHHRLLAALVDFPPMCHQPVATMAFTPPADIPAARDLTRLFRTLSDETRLRLLRLLDREELTVNELSAITQLAQPRISNHLKILREEGLITERRDGSWRHYRVERDRLTALPRALWETLESSWQDQSEFAADDKRLAEVLASRESSQPADFFDVLACQWDELRDSLFGDAIGRAVLRAFLPPGLVVADLGTGTGHMIELFGARAGRLIAVDRSEAMLAMARRKALMAGLTNNVEFRVADLDEASPLAPGEANVITLVQVLHHLADPAAALLRVAPGLHPAGGMMVLSDFIEHGEVWLRERMQHRWLGFSRGDIDRWAGAAGLRLASWEVLPGRIHEADGQRFRVPDAFVALITR